MAKGIAINGQLRGKIGGTVYYRANGEQISRSRNFHPNNPQTQSQMMQRLALANASKASKGLKEIIDHSFEGVRYGVDSVRNFESKAQLALKALSPSGGQYGTSYTPFVPLDALGFPVADYLVSTGSLPSAAGVFIQRTENGSIQYYRVALEMAEPSLATLTARQFCEAMGVSVDSQITFVYIAPQESIGGAGSDTIFADNILDLVVRINFDQDALDEPCFENNHFKTSSLVADRSTNVDLLEVTLEENALHLIYDEELSAAACIVSRFVDGMWRRSTEKLTIAATKANPGDYSLQDEWGWNWLDEIQKTLVKGASAAEDRLLNKEPNSDI